MASSSDPGHWLASPLATDAELREACIRACMEGILPDRFLELSPFESRVNRDTRLKRGRYKRFGNCWSKPIEFAAKQRQGQAICQGLLDGSGRSE